MVAGLKRQPNTKEIAGASSYELKNTLRAICFLCDYDPSGLSEETKNLTEALLIKRFPYVKLIDLREAFEIGIVGEAYQMPFRKDDTSPVSFKYISEVLKLYRDYKKAQNRKPKPIESNHTTLPPADIDRRNKEAILYFYNAFKENEDGFVPATIYDAIVKYLGFNIDLNDYQNDAQELTRQELLKDRTKSKDEIERKSLNIALERLQNGERTVESKSKHLAIKYCFAVLKESNKDLKKMLGL